MAQIEVEDFVAAYVKANPKAPQWRIYRIMWLVGAIMANNSFTHVADTIKPYVLAYLLATVMHETGQFFRCIEEDVEDVFGSKDAKWEAYMAHQKYANPDPVTGLRYYGRGFAQLTWKSEYANCGKVVGVDLVNNPDLAMDLGISAQCLVWGMVEGGFTTKKLSDYINGTTVDYVSCRRTINGRDKAELIAGYAKMFTPCCELLFKPIVVDTIPTVVTVDATIPIDTSEIHTSLSGAGVADIAPTTQSSTPGA